MKSTPIIPTIPAEFRRPSAETEMDKWLPVNDEVAELVTNNLLMMDSLNPEWLGSADLGAIMELFLASVINTARGMSQRVLELVQCGRLEDSSSATSAALVPLLIYCGQAVVACEDLLAGLQGLPKFQSDAGW